MTKPCALLFDTFGTIVDWRTSLIDELTAFGLERSIKADWAGLVDAWRGAYVPSMDEVRLGQRRWTKLDDLHRATLDRLVEKFGIIGLSEAELRHINRGWHRLRPWPDSVPGLTRLKQHFIIAPLSNGNVSLLPFAFVCASVQAVNPFEGIPLTELYSLLDPLDGVRSQKRNYV